MKSLQKGKIMASLCSAQDALVQAFLPADVLACCITTGDVDFVLYEKFQMLEKAFVPPFTDKTAETFQAFIMKSKSDGTYAPEPLENGPQTFVEFSITRSGPISRERVGFVHSGKIVNGSALPYFRTDEEEFLLIALKDGPNKYKAAAGSLEETDTIDEGKSLSLDGALAKGSLREFAEETLGLSKKDAKEMSLDALKTYIQTTLKCTKVACTVLIKQTLSGSYERLPRPEFNTDTMLSPSVVIDLGETSREDVESALKQNSPKDIPTIIEREIAMEPMTFRNAEQLRYHFEHPEIGYFV